MLVQGNELKVKESRFRLAIRQKFLVMRVGGPWYRLPRETVAASPLEFFKTMLDEA